MPEDDPRNKIFPGKFAYGGAHVIEELGCRKGCQADRHSLWDGLLPQKDVGDLSFRLKDMNEAMLFNVRNAYQNYNVAVNLSDRVIYTYMGVLQPKMG